MPLIKSAPLVIGLLGSGSASFYTSYKVYRLTWPKKWFNPKLQWDRLTLEESQKRMENFKKEIMNSRYEEAVPLSAIPMPGKTMFWAHPDDDFFWKERSKALQNNSSIPNDIQKLKTWCALRMNTQIYAKNMNGKVKFRSSKDSHVYVESIAQLTDLADIRNNCARMITNEEFYSNDKLAKGESKWQDKNCESLLKNYYSPTSIKNEFMNNCLASPKEKR